jgi:hypothetical protein
MKRILPFGIIWQRASIIILLIPTWSRPVLDAPRKVWTGIAVPGVTVGTAKEDLVAVFALREGAPDDKK